MNVLACALQGSLVVRRLPSFTAPAGWQPHAGPKSPAPAHRAGFRRPMRRLRTHNRDRKVLMKRARALMTGLLVAASFVACDKNPPPFSPVTPPAEIPISGAAVPGMGSYDQTITDFMRKYAIPGGAVAVLRDGKLIYARGFGYADVENKTPVQPDALFRLASVSKPITGVAIMKLVEDGKLRLDDRVTPLIADLRPAP